MDLNNQVVCLLMSELSNFIFLYPLFYLFCPVYFKFLKVDLPFFLYIINLDKWTIMYFFHVE